MKRALCVVLTICAFTLPPTPVHSTTPHVDGAVARWHDTAIAVGWPEASWPRLACILARESGGDPTAYNGRDPGHGSYGLAQVNMSKGRFGTWRLYAPILSHDITQLFDPTVNLAVALDLSERARRMWGDPWRPWRGGGCK